jgi:hypothetical protein
MITPANCQHASSWAAPTATASVAVTPTFNRPCLCRALNGGLGELRRQNYVHINNNGLLLTLLPCSRSRRLIAHIASSLLSGSDLNSFHETCWDLDCFFIFTMKNSHENAAG